MSMYIVSKSTIDRIVAALTAGDRDEARRRTLGLVIGYRAWSQNFRDDVRHNSRGLTPPSHELPSLANDDQLRTALGRQLWRMNLESAKAAYPGDENGRRPGPNDFTDENVEEYEWDPRTPRDLKANLAEVPTYLYQCVEATEKPCEFAEYWIQFYQGVQAAAGEVALYHCKAEVEKRSPDIKPWQMVYAEYV